jgi:hypothetical protein
MLKKKQLQWTPEAETTFVDLKQPMTQTPVLILPYFNQPSVVEADACATGVGDATSKTSCFSQ